MINDRQIIISAAGSRKATKWPQQKMYWSELVEKLAVPTRSTETLGEYMKYTKSKQDDLKDVGGFVAGSLINNKRGANTVESRDVITLDLDNIPAGQTDSSLARIDGLGCAYAIYSTRKHSADKPRLRVLIPTDRTVSADEYEPIARKLAQFIGIELCDPTTFQASRLMYWPSCCADATYVYAHGDKPHASADGMLATYTDWRNVNDWPQVPGAPQAHQKLADKQGDPTLKAGIVGAFCKTYDVYSAIETFIPDAYVPCDDGSGRYSYTGGSTTGGAVIYDNGNFLYSHHATDPAGSKLCNAFDLVRHHLYGDKDDEVKPDTPTTRMPSFTKMCELAVTDHKVSIILNQERYDTATQDFASPVVPMEEETANWIGKLHISPTTGQPAKTIRNILVILQNDPHLKGRLAYDEFASKALKMGRMPWDLRDVERPWEDVDDAGLRDYLEQTYGIASASKTEDAARLCLLNNTFNKVTTYLTGLVWDGVKRLDTLLIDYLGAVDTQYTRAVARKSLVAAVARAMVPGCKYDTMPILAGPQGIGKSTFLRLLGKSWYSDSLQTFEGKEASEMIQGVWINEVGELNGLNKSETNAVKQFLSRVEDIYRVPFDKRTKNFPRRGVFFGTTNEKEFLRDATGERRFWPVDVGVNGVTKSVFDDLESEVDQIWAEAFVYWQLGEQIYLTGTAKEESERQQEAHREIDSREGIVKAFVERRVPYDWETKSINDRKLYWSCEFGKPENTDDLIARRDICAVEVLCECLGYELKYIKQTDTRAINKILKKLGWHEKLHRFGPYSVQRGFIKPL